MYYISFRVIPKNKIKSWWMKIEVLLFSRSKPNVSIVCLDDIDTFIERAVTVYESGYGDAKYRMFYLCVTIFVSHIP
jgi:hypothetical protein